MASRTLTYKSGATSAVLSAWVIALMTLAALLAGLALRQSVEGLAAPQERLGVSATFPKGWIVERPIEVSGIVFKARAALDPTLNYAVSLEPSAADLPLSVLAYNRNLKRAQSMPMYTVLDQEEVILKGMPAYKVHFAYVYTGDPQAKPVVIEGMDYYFPGQPKALVVSFEDQTDLFEQAMPRFMQFLDTVNYHSGAAQ